MAAMAEACSAATRAASAASASSPSRARSAPLTGSFRDGPHEGREPRLVRGQGSGLAHRLDARHPAAVDQNVGRRQRGDTMLVEKGNGAHVLFDEVLRVATRYE